MIGDYSLNKFARDRIRALKHLPEAYRMSFQYGWGEFIGMLLLFPLLVFLALLFGRSEQDSVTVLHE
jgi:hypothetical protein